MRHAFLDFDEMNWQVCFGHYVLSVQKLIEVEDVWEPRYMWAVGI